jgi:hypothetical protein
MSPDDGDGYDSGADRVQRAARERQHERTPIVEDALAGVPGLLAAEKYPTTAEELTVEYADETVDLPDETESLGSVFDRLVDERFESPADAREAILHQLSGEAGGPGEANDERPLAPFDDSAEERPE